MSVDLLAFCLFKTELEEVSIAVAPEEHLELQKSIDVYLIVWLVGELWL